MKELDVLQHAHENLSSGTSETTVRRFAMMTIEMHFPSPFEAATTLAGVFGSMPQDEHDGATLVHAVMDGDRARAEKLLAESVPVEVFPHPQRARWDEGDIVTPGEVRIAIDGEPDDVRVCVRFGRRSLVAAGSLVGAAALACEPDLEGWRRRYAETLRAGEVT